MSTSTDPYVPGLEGIVAARTAISSVDGVRGELIVRGLPIEDLAPNAEFEETLFLLWNERLPDATALAAFKAELSAHRAVPSHTLGLLRAAAAGHAAPMDALRMACASLTSADVSGNDARRPAASRDAALGRDAVRAVAAFPTIVAAYHRLSMGLEPIDARPDLSHAANFLYQLSGAEPAAAFVRALDTYLNTVVDHGLNASTFTARVIISTESDLISALTGAVGALKGPLHGGAPGPALDLVFEIGSADRADAVLRAKLAAGERLMGFGHRVYRTRDPRAEVLAAAARRLFEGGADLSLYNLARDVEQVALRVLREHKPDRQLQTNVEFYTALVLHGLGFPTSLFTPTFAISRAGGWTAHAIEQMRGNRLFRPQSVYNGPRDRTWIPRGER